MDVALKPTAARDFFLARQPILNRAQELIGYELLFRSAMENVADVIDDVKATASVIAGAAELGLNNVIGSWLGFINVDAEVLLSDFIFFLPKEHIVLEILETLKVTPLIVKRMEMLAEYGFEFALDDVVADSPEIGTLLPYIKIIKIDVLAVPPEKLEQLTRDYRLLNKELLAEKVETLEQYKICEKLGFDYFQGYFFAKPVVLAGQKLKPLNSIILQVLTLVMRNANNGEIVRFIKQDIALSLMLLRLVNTPVYGFRRYIASLGQALLVLGDRQLKRWLQILLYVDPTREGGSTLSPLMVLAATRGKMLELCSERLRPRRPNVSDIAFSVGILSLADTLLNVEMRVILAQISASAEIRDALLSRSGFYGEILQLCESSELFDIDRIRVLGMLEKLELSADDFYEIQKQSIEWGRNISDNMRSEPAPSQA
ncbi:EAL domain-containing protein [Oxalobacteraceae bacterium CAVE-383]|nr:EAL domain-containing protein [Oxalobacteraceae bacterium CAVE-383]